MGTGSLFVDEVFVEPVLGRADRICHIEPETPEARGTDRDEQGVDRPPAEPQIFKSMLNQVPSGQCPYFRRVQHHGTERSACSLPARR